jgi:hypothetical protein
MICERYVIDRRRYDLDWLRVLAFGVLILYHTGMFYVADWGWHIKSTHTSENLQYLMLLVNPWRMPLLFLVSGAALWFAARKISPTGLMKLRLLRLLPPLALGMLVIVPPQIYLQILQWEGVELGYVAFYRLYLDLGTEAFPKHQSPLGLVSWTHLWFIPYLLIYTLAFVILKSLLDRLAFELSRLNPSLVWLYALPLAVLLPIGLFLEPRFPRTYAIVGDWYAHALYFSAFVFGYIGAGQLYIVRTLVANRRLCLGISLVTYLLFVLMGRGHLSLELLGSAAGLVRTSIAYLNGWGWILTVLAWSAAYLNRPSRLLTYMNTAILPWYVLHQTLTILLAWQLSKLGMPVGLEAMLVVAGTVAGCMVGYEFIRRYQPWRFLFGLKPAGGRPRSIVSRRSSLQSPPEGLIDTHQY